MGPPSARLARTDSRARGKRHSGPVIRALVPRDISGALARSIGRTPGPSLVLRALLLGVPSTLRAVPRALRRITRFAERVPLPHSALPPHALPVVSLSDAGWRSGEEAAGDRARRTVGRPRRLSTAGIVRAPGRSPVREREGSVRTRAAARAPVLRNRPPASGVCPASWTHSTP